LITNEKTVSYNLTLSFITEEGHFIGLTSSPATFTAVAQFTSFTYPTEGDVLGNYYIQQSFRNIYFGLYPTPQYNSYNLSFGLYDRENYYPLRNCAQTSELNVQCTMVSLINSFSDWNSPKKFQLDLRINNIYALRLSPYFTIYPYIQVLSVSTFYFRIGSEASKILIHLKNPIQFSGYNPLIQYQNENTQGVGTCSIKTSNELECGVPTFSLVGNYSLAISVNAAASYQPLNTYLQFFDDTNITITSVSQNDLSFTRETEIYIKGSNFLNSNQIQVALFENTHTRISRGILINSTHIKTHILPFYDLNVVYPLKLSLKLSFNNGLQYKESSMVLTVKKFKNPTISPSMISKDVLSSGLLIEGLNGTIYFNESKYQMGYQLYFNSSVSIPLNCTKFTKCELKSKPTILGSYTLKFGLIDLKSSSWTDIYIFCDTNIVVYGQIVSLTFRFFDNHYFFHFTKHNHGVE
jgi:hypothetical protein